MSRYNKYDFRRIDESRDIVDVNEHSFFKDNSVSSERERATEEFLDENFDDAMIHMSRYLDKLKERKIVLKKKGEEDFVFLDYTTRFSKSYKNKIKQKLRGMVGNVKMKRACGHLVLTIENMSARELDEKKNDISETFHRFFIKVQRWTGNVDRIVTREVTMNEADKRLHLHFHCLLLGWRYRKDLEDIKKEWAKAGESMGLKTKYLHYTFVNNIRDVVGYVTKYITKDFKTLNLTSLSLSLLKLRSFTTNIKRTIENHVEEAVKSFEYVGVILKSNIEEFMRRVIVYKDLIMITPHPATAGGGGLCIWM